MSGSGLFRIDPREPLGFLSSERPAPEAFARARCLRVEFSSRGDRVPGRLLLPGDRPGPAPLLLFQHGLGGSKEAEYLDVAARWVDGGAAVLSLDLPLHGERTSAKMSERLRATWAETGKGRTLEGPARILWIEVARQAVADLQRAIDALAGIPEVDCKRVAFAGFSLGAMIGGVFCAVDPRPRAAALALAAGGIGPVEVDPCSYVGAIAPRPVLLIGAEDDATIPRTATEALFAAAGEPKQLEWYEGTHQRLPGVALKTMWSFLAKALELAP